MKVNQALDKLNELCSGYDRPVTFTQLSLIIQALQAPDSAEKEEWIPFEAEIKSQAGGNKEESLEAKFKEWWLMPKNPKNAYLELTAIAEVHFAKRIEEAKEQGYIEGFGETVLHTTAYKKGKAEAIAEMKKKFNSCTKGPYACDSITLGKILFGPEAS